MRWLIQLFRRLIGYSGRRSIRLYMADWSEERRDWEGKR